MNSETADTETAESEPAQPEPAEPLKLDADELEMVGVAQTAIADALANPESRETLIAAFKAVKTAGGNIDPDIEDPGSRAKIEELLTSISGTDLSNSFATAGIGWIQKPEAVGDGGFLRGEIMRTSGGDALVQAGDTRVKLIGRPILYNGVHLIIGKIINATTFEVTASYRVE
ncbi:MAG: hypothetical protein AAF664_11990, partial [Planctomycetota bacterium]